MVGKLIKAIPLVSNGLVHIEGVYLDQAKVFDLKKFKSFDVNIHTKIHGVSLRIFQERGVISFALNKLSNRDFPEWVYAYVETDVGLGFCIEVPREAKASCRWVRGMTEKKSFITPEGPKYHASLKIDFPHNSKVPKGQVATCQKGTMGIRKSKYHIDSDPGLHIQFPQNFVRFVVEEEE